MKKYFFVLSVLITYFSNSYSQTGWFPLSSWTEKTIYSIDFANSLTGWSVGSDGLVIKTTNGGMTWSEQSLDPVNQFFCSYIMNSNTGFTAGVNSNTGKGVILKTTNGGTNWFSTYNNPDIEFFNSIFFVNDNTGWVVGTGNNKGVIYKTTNCGEYWDTQESSANFGLNGIHFANTLTGWIVASNSGTCKVLKTTNGGLIWDDNSPTGSIKGLKSVFFINSNTGWAVGEEGTIIKTTNGGDGWFRQINGLDSNYDLQSLHFPDAQTGWVVGSKGIILKTTNGGTNWSIQYTNILHNFHSVHFDNNFVGWTAGINGTILKTISGGQNFFQTLIKISRNINKPITNGQNIYDTISIPFSGLNYVYDINLALDTILNTPDSSLVLILYHEGIYDTLIYHAGGAGSNFIGTVLNDSASTSITNGIPPFTGQYRPHRSLSQFNNTKLEGDWIFITTDNSVNPLRTGVIKSWGVIIVNNNLINVPRYGNLIPAFSILEQNYPNPFNSSSKIKYKITNCKNINTNFGNELVTLKIFDVLGRVIATLVNEIQPPGNYEITWDASQYPSGVYFYKLETQSYKESKRMLLIK